MELEIHGEKLNGKCEFCGRTNCLVNCFQYSGRNVKCCNRCLFEEFNIKKKTIFEKLEDNNKEVCVACKEKQLIKTDYGFLCLSCNTAFNHHYHELIYKVD
jgi:hypothetical protein